jgi:AraC-like DNA-binding protein
MKPLLFDVSASLRNSIYIKEVKARHLVDQFHFHNAFEIALIIKGSGRRIVGDSIENFCDGDLILMAPNLPHASYSDRKYHEHATSTKIHAIVVYFQPDWITETHWNSQDFAPLKALFNELKRGIRLLNNTHQAVMNLLLSLRDADGLKSFVILIQILDIISRSGDYSCLASRDYSNTYDEHNIRKIHNVYKYVMENFTNKIMLDDIAAVAFMTPPAFCKYFKSKTSKTFTAFVNEIRIGYACQLLIEGHLDISSVCYECGFNNFTSFNENFKHFKGITPSEYKARFVTHR